MPENQRKRRSSCCSTWDPSASFCPASQTNCPSGSLAGDPCLDAGKARLATRILQFSAGWALSSEVLCILLLGWRFGRASCVCACVAGSGAVTFQSECSRRLQKSKSGNQDETPLASALCSSGSAEPRRVPGTYILSSGVGPERPSISQGTGSAATHWLAPECRRRAVALRSPWH